MKISLVESNEDKIEVIIKGKLNNPEINEILSRLNSFYDLETISYKIDDKTYYEDIKKVECFVCEENKVFAIINGVKHKINFTLNELENIKDFIRISKQTIINKTFVKYVEVEFNENYYLHTNIKNYEKYILTRKYVKNFKESMR